MTPTPVHESSQVWGADFARRTELGNPSAAVSSARQSSVVGVLGDLGGVAREDLFTHIAQDAWSLTPISTRPSCGCSIRRSHQAQWAASPWRGIVRPRVHCVSETAGPLVAVRHEVLLPFQALPRFASVSAPFVEGCRRAVCGAVPASVDGCGSPLGQAYASQSGIATLLPGGADMLHARSVVSAVLLL